MTHPLARRRRDARDIRNHRLRDVLANEFRTCFLITAADLADHDDAFGLRIRFKQCQHIHKVHTAHRITTDTNTSALAQAKASRLENCFIGQCAGPGHNADLAGLVYEPGHDANLCFTRRNHARAIRPNETRVVTLQGFLDANHIVHRNAFRDTDDQRNACIGGFQNGVSSARGRDVDHADISARRPNSIVGGIEYRQSQMLLPSSSRRDTANESATVGDALLRMEGALLASEALDNDSALFGQKYAHGRTS